MFDPNPTRKGKSKGVLHVHVKNAKSLPNMDTIGYTDGFVKMSLLPNRVKRKKTSVVNDDLNPIWNEKFTFTNMSLDELSTQQVLELTVWDHDTLSSNDFIGCVRLGPTPGDVEGKKEWMDSSGTEAKHWKDMLAHPGEWVESTHSLRPSMDPRKVDSPALVIEQEVLPPANVEEEKEEEGRGAFRPRVYPSIMTVIEGVGMHGFHLFRFQYWFIIPRGGETNLQVKMEVFWKKWQHQMGTILRNW